MDDWRDQLPPYTRQACVEKITHTLKGYDPFIEEEGLLELQKIAQRLEEKAYATGSTKSDYHEIITLKLILMETGGTDWQEGAYQKIQTMKETYLPELNEMYQKLSTKLEQLESLPQQPGSYQIEKMRIFRTMLERIITFLQVSKSQVLPSFREKLPSYERQIKNFVCANRPRKPMTLQQGLHPQPHTQQPQS